MSLPVFPDIRTREYEQCLKPMARAVLPRPVIPRSGATSALKQLMVLLPAIHIARLDAQHARIVAVLRSKKIEAGFRTPRSAAKVLALSKEFAFQKARTVAAMKAMEESVRFCRVYKMLGEGLDADVPGLIATTSYSRSAATSLEGWKTLAEVRRQEVNTLVSQIDRQKMQLRGLGADVQYRNKPGWYVTSNT